MASSTNAWSSPPAPEADHLSNHLAGLSIDEFLTPPRQTAAAAAAAAAAGVGGTSLAYNNVHTSPRPQAFAPYNAANPYVYFPNGDAAPFSPQPYPYDPSTPVQSMSPTMAAAYNPYPTPPETYAVHGNADSHAATTGGLHGHHQSADASYLFAGNRSGQVYRPPHALHPQQLRDMQDTAYMTGYTQRGTFWPYTPDRHGGAVSGADIGTVTPMATPNPRQKSHRMAPNGPRRNAHHHHQSQPQAAFVDPQTFPGLTSFTTQYGLQTPISPAFTNGAGATFSVAQGFAGSYPTTPLHFGGYSKRGRHLPTEEVASGRSPRLEEFRQRKNARMEFSELYGHICEFAGDQHGSRLIQNKLETASPEERAKVFEEIMPNAYQLMTDVFGNYVIQKLFEHGDTSQKVSLAKKMEGHVLHLSMQMYGCRVMQKALEHLLVEQRDKLIAELDGHIIECVKSSNANHVIQRLITLDPPKRVIDAFIGHVQDLSSHPFGCRVLQKAFEILEPCKIRPLLDEMHSCSLSLTTNQFGNYVVQSVLSSAPGREADRDRVINEMKGRIFDLCRHKFASNVVERAIRHATPDDKRDIICEMLGEGGEGDAEKRIGTLLRDGFGNFTVQTALSEAGPDQREALLSIIVPLMPTLRNTPCGRRLEGTLAEYSTRGLMPDIVAPPSPSSSASHSPDLKTADNHSDHSSVDDKLAVPDDSGAGNGSPLRQVASSSDARDEQVVLSTLLA